MDFPSSLLGPDGPFAGLLSGFAPRPEQQAMADAVADALSGHEVLIAEAGTGTGKTFAYLVPALLSGEKVIISTGTRNLQDQLFHRDLPLVRKALKLPVEVALLKGRANYLCPHRLELVHSEGRLRYREDIHTLSLVTEWSGRTEQGDLAELTELPEDSLLIPMITSTADNCLGGDCPQLDGCFLMQARQRAQQADILVVNHHLLFADMALRDDGFGELLPGANAYILDEAHQLPEVASSFFGRSLTGNQLLELARDAAVEEKREAPDQRQVADAAQRLENTIRELRLSFGAEPRRGAWQEVAEIVAPFMAHTENALSELADALVPCAGRGRGLEQVLRRAEELAARFTELASETPDGFIHWYETHPRSFSVHLTPMDVSNLFSDQVARASRAWVLTSATLTVDGRFDHFAGQLGLDPELGNAWPSPFDYREQGLFYVPEEMPEPADPGFTAAVVEVALSLADEVPGGMFLLFTSHRALQEAAELLGPRLRRPMLVQGTAPRQRLLERFRSAGEAVLLGTGSFWEGVDVRGEALSCVIIDKLPFASPGDPVMKARIDALRMQGANPFYDYQLPQAAITLKQGAGRLIRDVNDYGVLAVCDPRLLGRSYGRVLLDSLPRMSRTRSLAVVQRFFEHHRQAGSPDHRKH